MNSKGSGRQVLRLNQAKGEPGGGGRRSWGGTCRPERWRKIKAHAGSPKTRSFSSKQEAKLYYSVSRGRGSGLTLAGKRKGDFGNRGLFCQGWASGKRKKKGGGRRSIDAKIETTRLLLI